jgi:hypothetical protein
MEIDVTTTGRSQNDPDRKVVLGHPEPENTEGLQNLGQRHPLDNQVHVIVPARLLPQESIHTPSPIEPHP